MTKFQIVPERSRVWIEAESSVHPIHGESTGLQGYIEAATTDERLDLSSPATFSVELPVEQLKSGNKLQDREMARRIEAKKHPVITGEAQDVEHLEADRYRLRGHLAFHGVTQAVEGEVILTLNGDGSMVVSGEQVFDIRDYDVKPPKILTLKVHPQVKVRIEVIAEAVG